MVELRITKYSPALRDSLGRYTRDEWTSVSDVGETYCGRIITLEEYLSVESEYVSVIDQIMEASGVRELTLSGLEIHGYDYVPIPIREECARDLQWVRNGRTLDSELVRRVVRLALREVIWCRLAGQRDFYVHFGYDYYMYAGFSGAMEEIASVSTPLFIEEFVSPYHPEDDSCCSDEESSGLWAY